MDVRLPDGRVITNVPEGTTQTELLRRLERADKKEPIQDPLTVETNKAAAEAISAAIPEPVKEAAGAVADVAVAGFEMLPESVQSTAKKTGNALLDGLSYLDRPRQALFVGAKPVLQAGAKEEDPTKIFELSILNKAADTLKSLGKQEVRTAAIEGMGRGWRGEEKASTQELLSDEFRKENPVTSLAFGLAGDIAGDPLNLIAPFKSTKELISIGSGSTTIPSKLMDNELFRAINITVGDVDKTRELFNKYRYIRDKARSEGVRGAKNFNKQLKQLSKETDIPVNELKAKLLNDIETGKLDTGTLAKIESDIVKRNRALLEQQRAAGVEIGDLGETYMPHIVSKESDEWLTKIDKKKPSGSGPTAKNPNAIKREIEGTVAEINAKNLYGTSKYFEDDPAILIGMQEFRAANAVAGKSFLNSVKELGVKEADAPASFVSIKGIEGVKFDPAVANYAKHSYQVLTNDEAMSKFLRIYDGAQNWWKMWSLGVRPAYHAKNVVGNLWNSYLGGISSPQPYAQAAAFQYKLGKDKLTGTIAGKPVKELYEEMAKRGVFGEGQYGYAEFSKVLRQELDPIKATDIITPSTRNVILRGGFKVGQTLEDNARIALFLDQIQKGKNYDQAGKHVQKYLFDYGDVSPFERSTLKRAMPFYTWSRKNIPLQLESIVRHPDRVNKLNIGIDNIQRAFGAEVLDPSEAPDYVVNAGPVYLGEGNLPGTQAAITLENLLPIMDLGIFTKFLNTRSTPKGPKRGQISDEAAAAMGPISPLIKTPIEIFSDYDFFKKQNLEKFEGQTVDLLGIEMTPWQAKILSNIVVLNEFDRLNPGDIFGLRAVDPETGNIISKPGIFGAERGSRMDQPDEQRRGLQYLTGIRVFDVDKGMAEYQRWKRIKSDVSRLKGIVTSAAGVEKTRESDQALEALNKFLTELDKIEEEIKARKEKK